MLLLKNWYKMSQVSSIFYYFSSNSFCNLGIYEKLIEYLLSYFFMLYIACD